MILLIERLGFAMREETVLGLSKGEKIFIVLFLVIIFSLFGWFLPVIAEWIVNFPFVPNLKIVEFILSFNHSTVSIISLIIGFIAAILLSFNIIAESLEVTISPQNITLKMKENIDTIDKRDITAIFMEKKELVILGSCSIELYREELDVKKEKAKEAFHYYRYPWHDEDPYKDHYERWVPDHPDFSEKINALLDARAKALEEDERDDAKQLRKDLAKLGVIIKDEKNAQYVRLAKKEE